jgi:ATP-dependent Lhr-like helicase
VRQATTTKWAASVTQQLLARHGVLTREAVTAESIAGGFGVVYPVLKQMEDTGRIRRGYFVAGLGATQFALPGAVDLLRSLRDRGDDESTETVVLAATDPANPYGATLKWPASGPDEASPGQTGAAAAAARAGRAPTRSVGATVILVDGALAAYLGRGDRQLTTYLPETEPDRSRTGRAIARALIDRARSGVDAPRGMLIEEIDGHTPSQHPLARYLGEAGFLAGALGMQADVRSRHSPVAGPKTQSPVAHDPARRSDHQSDARRAGRSPRQSTVSSPFARRYFEQESPDDGSDD